MSPRPITMIEAEGDWLRRVAAGAATAEDLGYLAHGFRAYLRAQGSITLDRCLQLPSTEAQFLRMRRDEHLCAAASHASSYTGWQRAEYLVSEWSRLLPLALYEQWRRQGEPAADAPPLRRELFWASTYNRHEVLSVRSVFDIVGR